MFFQEYCAILLNRTSLQYYLVMAIIFGSTSSQYQSPCPSTFQYDMDENGLLYGSVGVYSTEEDVVQLNVQLSVGNHINNFNGRIELAIPREQVLNSIQLERPIKYKIFFPMWKNIPPKVTKIVVNGDLVCSGPPLQHSEWFDIITTVNLQHRFTASVSPLRFHNNPRNDVVRNPFLSQKRGKHNQNIDFSPDYNEEYKPSKLPSLFLFEKNERNNVNSFDSDFFNEISSTTTFRPIAPIVDNDLIYEDNPFINARKSPSSTSAQPDLEIVSPSYTNVCGLPIVPNPLILNGEKVPHGAYPWLVAMFVSTGIGVEYSCAGSLITGNHVITAAHCLQRRHLKIAAEKLLLILGKLNIENLLIANGEKMVGAQSFHIHPDYVPLNSDADLAIIVLSQTTQFTKFIRPICLWTESDDLELIVGDKGKVVGWGRDENNNSVSSEAREVTSPIVSQEQCLRSFEAFKEISSTRTFCAGDRNGKGPCNGDSGTGFIMKRQGRWFLRGIVSISIYDSIKSCDLSHYVVFTDVSKFRKWLFSIIDR